MKRVLIVIGGTEFPEEEVSAEKKFLISLAQSALYILAADGGAKILLAAGIIPHKVIGDLDSLTPETLEQLRRAEVPLISYPAKKAKSDLHLALEEAFSLKPEEVWIYGGRAVLMKRKDTGNDYDLFRPDHFLINVNLLLLGKKKGGKIRWFPDRRTELFLAGKVERITASPWDIVSLIPLSFSVSGITLDGFLYPLEEETLFKADSRGLSNQLVLGKGIIKKDRGDLLVCVIKKGIPENFGKIK